MVCLLSDVEDKKTNQKYIERTIPLNEASSSSSSSVSISSGSSRSLAEINSNDLGKFHFPPISKEIQDIIDWIHVGNSSNITTRILTYFRQLIVAFYSSSSSQSPSISSKTESVQASSSVLSIINSYTLWLLQSEQFEFVVTLVGCIRTVCKQLPATLSSTWKNIPSVVENDIQVFMKDRYNCKFHLPVLCSS